MESQAVDPMKYPEWVAASDADELTSFHYATGKMDPTRT
jgi:hypothetical protein